MTKQNIPNTEEAWENGKLGRDEKFVKADNTSEALAATIDDSLKLKLISIRMRESLINDLKLIAKKEGLGYQPLMKQILERFVDCELKQYARDRLHEDQIQHHKTSDKPSTAAAYG